jgi:hypothetical protein
MKPPRGRPPPPARPATLDSEQQDEEDEDDPLSPTPSPWSRRTLAPPPPSAAAASRAAASAAAAAAAAASDGDDDDDGDDPVDPDAPVDLSRIKSAPPGLADSSQRRLAGRGPTSSLRALLAGKQPLPPGPSAPGLPSADSLRGRGPLSFLWQPAVAAAATRASAAAAAAVLAEQRAALQRRMATAFALDAGGDDPFQQQQQRQQQKQSAAAAAAAQKQQAHATALAAALAQGLGPGFGPATEPGAFWRATLHLVVTPAWALVLLLSWLCNQWQRLWRPLGRLLWWVVDAADRRAPLAVEWALWVLGEASLVLHVVATGTVLGLAGVTLRECRLSHNAAPREGGGAHAHVAWLWSRLGGGGGGGGSVAAAAAAAGTAAAAVAGVAAAPAVTEAARVAAIVVLALYALSHYCMAAAMFRELDLHDATAAAAGEEQGGGGADGDGNGGPWSGGGGGYYFSDLVAFLGRLLDVLLHDVQLCAATVHGNRVLPGGAQLAFRGYEEARVAFGALLFTGPSAAALAWAHCRGAAARGAVSGGGGLSAADVAGQLKEVGSVA